MADDKYFYKWRKLSDFILFESDRNFKAIMESINHE